jgi:dTDP-4-amino-4,6-dideoxygalactose transaminase
MPCALPQSLGLRVVAVFAVKDEDKVVMPGINGKMSELQATLGLVVLDYIEEESAHRMS